MANILVLAPSGFGKTSSYGQIEKLGIKGLNPAETFLISIKGKPLPFSNAKDYKVTTALEFKKGNRVISNNAEEIASLLANLSSDKCPFKNIVIDDTNYIMQDWYMGNALKTGWDAPKKIGFFMGKIFEEIGKFQETNKNIIMLAHGEDVKGEDGRTYTKLKTTGKMVDEYVTPEGLFEIVLVGKSRYDEVNKKVVKEYITNESEYYSSPKSPYGMFDDLFIPNDLGYVIDKINEFYK